MFDYFPNYFLQKAVAYAISKIKGREGKTPSDIVNFLVHLLKSNDNSHNNYSDDYYVACLVHAIANIRPSSPVCSSDIVFFLELVTKLLQWDKEKLERAIEKYLEREKSIPSYHHVITVACLSSVAVLQAEGVFDKNLGFFRDYLVYGNYDEVRVAAAKALISLGINSDIPAKGAFPKVCSIISHYSQL